MKPLMPCVVLAVGMSSGAWAQGRGVQVSNRAAAPMTEPPPASCVDKDGHSACGYHCLTGPADGEVACSTTPQGTCQVVADKVVCWDPPTAFLAQLGVEFPAARCVSNFGQVACGYRCVEHGGNVKCAASPWGRCTGNYGKVVCFDPPVGLVAQMGGQVPVPECVEHSGQLACGYHCVADQGQLQCATTPQGRCNLAGGRIVCFDPPLAGVPAVRDCIQSGTNRACGYHCLHHGTQVGCAETPQGSCSVVEDRVECRE